MACNMRECQCGAKLISVDQCSAGRSSNLFNAGLKGPKSSTKARTGNRVHQGWSDSIPRSAEDQEDPV